jgi:hypothetical protein
MPRRPSTRTCEPGRNTWSSWARGTSLIDRLAADGVDAFGRTAPNDWDLHRYVADALTSGWPEALRTPSDRARDRWLTGYVDHLVTREAPALGVARDPVRMRKYLQTIAANTAGTPTHKVLYDAAGIGRHTATSYDDLLGRTLDTYVATHLRAECSLSIIGADLFHLRDANGRHEVDLLVETRDGHVIAIEIKATAAPSRADARHLASGAGSNPAAQPGRLADRDRLRGGGSADGPRPSDQGDRAGIRRG